MPRLLSTILAALLMSGIAATASAQRPGDTSPQQNVKESQQYEQLLCTNPAFRAKRIAQECGSLQGSQFYDSCLASFNCKNPPTASQWRRTPPSEKIE